MDFTKKIRPETIIVKSLAYVAAIVTLSILSGLIIYIFVQGFPAVSWTFLTTVPSFLDQTYGILPLVINTLYLVVIGLAFTLPLGIGSALYLSEYSKQSRLINIIRFTIEILAGLPSIIFGLFGALFFVTFFDMGYSILAGACTLALITLPIVIRTTEESIKSVDVSYREAALSLGVNRLHIIKTVLLPCSVPGIVTAIVLSIGRMVGESAALLCTSGTAYDMPYGLFDHITESGATLTVQLYQCFTERPPGMNDQTPFAIAAVLMFIVLILNTITGFIGSRLNRKAN